MSDEIEYIEPTQEHVGQMVEVRDYIGQRWKRMQLCGIVKHGYRFITHDNLRVPSGYRFARIPRPQPQPAEPPTKPIDWTKPVRTKDGRAVRVLCTDGPGSHPIIGIVEGVREPFCWEVTGVYEEGVELGIELENVPQRIQREYWANIYSNGAGGLFETKKDADRVAGTERIACVPIPIDCEKGEGLYW